MGHPANPGLPGREKKHKKTTTIEPEMRKLTETLIDKTRQFYSHKTAPSAVWRKYKQN